MDAREELKRWIATVIQSAAKEGSAVIKQDIDLFLSVAADLSGKLAERNVALARQKQPRKAKPPKSAPANGPQQRKQPASSTDTPSAQKDAEDRTKELSSIQQGIRQADPSLADQQRALRGYVYGAQNDEVAFRKAAQAIAR
jgi:hypothetical protein